MRITDIHAHAFPDSLAERAIRALEAESEDAKACLDGRISSLLASMDRAGIERSVICPIATKPEQFDPILRWSRSIASARIVPFGSIHPMDPERLERIDRIAAAGLKGIKMHPYYQDYFLDDPGLFPFYRRIEERGLILIVHTGFDLAFPRIRRGDPRRILRVTESFPRLKLVTTHLGAWEDWEAVREHLLGKPVWMEFSYTLSILRPKDARAMLLAHPAEYLLFGTDSPWRDQAEELALLRALDLGADRERAILDGNAERLLG